jgi:hypothetical protein
LELLLFLSAMLAGLTGLISGDRAVDVRQVERAAIAAGTVSNPASQSPEASARAEQPVAGVVLYAALSPAPALPAAASASPQTAPVDERRLE